MEFIHSPHDMEQAFALVCGFFTTFAVIASYVFLMR